MKVSLTTSGLLDPKRLDSWVPETRRALRKAVEAGLKAGGRELAEQVRGEMGTRFKVRRPNFLKSMRAKVYAGNPQKFPALMIGSRIAWLGIHARGGAIRGKMLIPLLPEHQRIGPKAFRRVITGLLHTGNAYFIEKNGKVILMAENIKENVSELRRFKRAERSRSGAKSIKRGEELPIAVLVPLVRLGRRLDLTGIVQGNLSRLVTQIDHHLKAHGF
jgi:hypothetical protein